MTHRFAISLSVALAVSLSATGAMAQTRQGRPTANPALSVLRQDSPARTNQAAQAFVRFAGITTPATPTNSGAASNPTQVNPFLLRQTRGVEGRPQLAPTPSASGDLTGKINF